MDLKNKNKNNNKVALISVYDKTGVEELAYGLYQLGYIILASGGTHGRLKKYFVAKKMDRKMLIEISTYTGSPEILGGRVKTLHPKIHGGILAQRELAHDKKDVREQNILLIDVVVVNLYPFEEKINASRISMKEAIEHIDIGGVTLLRAASKNCEYVTCLVNPADYEIGLSLLKKQLESSDKKSSELCMRYRKALAASSFAHTAHYEAIIAEYMKLEVEKQSLPPLDAENKSSIATSAYKTVTFELQEQMRYGENPHQNAGLYAQSWPYPNKRSLINANQIHGKKLSFNNIRDAEAAISIAHACVQDEVKEKMVAVGIKHGNPCGVAISESIYQAWNKCYLTDTVSIFGGIVALTHEVDKRTALAMSKIFLEIIIAPKFSAEAKQILTKKKNVRLLELSFQEDNAFKKRFKQYVPQQFSSINGGVLVQDADNFFVSADMLHTVTKKKPTHTQIEELVFAWNVCKYVKSNAIVITKGKSTAGVGTGQMNRVGAASLALEQAKMNGRVKGAVLASDAFFPMNDTVKLAAKYGIAAIIQPGGSIKDSESIEACNTHGIAMVTTGIRHFLH